MYIEFNGWYSSYIFISCNIFILFFLVNNFDLPYYIVRYTDRAQRYFRCKCGMYASTVWVWILLSHTSFAVLFFFFWYLPLILCCTYFFVLCIQKQLFFIERISMDVRIKVLWHFIEKFTVTFLLLLSSFLWVCVCVCGCICIFDEIKLLVVLQYPYLFIS